MKLSFSLLTVLSLLLGALLTACAGAGQAAAPKLDGTHWQLVEMNGQKLPLYIIITLSFEDGLAGGQAPCNGYGADYTQNGDQLTLGQVVTTLMYCEGIMDYETEFHTAFSAVKSFKIENDLLSLQNESGATVLLFGQPQLAPSLDGSSWKAILIGETIVPEEVELTLSFAEGQISGKAACNSYFAEFTQQESALTFGMAGSTKMYCEGLMELETAFLSSLDKVRSFEIQMGSLALLDENGTVLIQLRP